MLSTGADLKRITLLVRNPDRLNEILGAVAHFFGARPPAGIIVIGAAAPLTPTTAHRLERLGNMDIDRYTDTPGPIAGFGFEVVGRQRITQVLDGADIVIAL